MVGSRGENYWNSLFEESILKVVRYLPPDDGIPVPDEFDRIRIRNARRRYAIAIGMLPPCDSEESVVAERDRAQFGPEADPTELPEGIDAGDVVRSIFAHAHMAEFVMRLAGVDVETYVAVTYEDTLMSLNRPEVDDFEYARIVETEYMVALEVLDEAKRIRASRKLSAS
jgi:hypothetical protein